MAQNEWMWEVQQETQILENNRKGLGTGMETLENKLLQLKWLSIARQVMTHKVATTRCLPVEFAMQSRKQLTKTRCLILTN